MTLARYLCIVALWLATAQTALADDSTPQAAPPPPAATEPTAPPAVDTVPAPAAPDTGPVPTAAPPAVDSGPVDMSSEHAGSAGSATEHTAPPPDVAPTALTHSETGPHIPGITLNPGPQPQGTTPGSTSPSGSTGTTGSSSLSGAAPGSADTSTGVSPIDPGAITSPYTAVSSPAPSQLTCHGRQHGDALPFLVSPYSGWTEVASFLDHDSPDYTVDGSIVLANGTTASSSDGQESDMFPAYWSPTLRQFVNYDGHNGYDFEISYQPVLAAGSGTVKFAGWNSSDEFAGYGQMILIDHHNGYVTLYGHLSSLDVQQGDHVTAGQQIGISGSTGHSSGPHLHFSVFHNCSVTDPYGWTGHGTDPLYTFDNEHATYLWLPGHDPLVLNPPPSWPTFPLGLRLPATAAGKSTLLPRTGSIRTPPIDRLLLLNLPESHTVGTSSSAVALARTEAAINQEAETLAPTLDDLKNQGLIERYQIIPAAAAVWLRGTASSSQLLSLPGVASLAGVRARDVTAAQAGLAHDVLIQIGRQQAPALWPVGFRSTQNTWRPVMTVVNGHALVTGVALPGQGVAFSERRRGQIVGVAETTTDAQTGGFVAMLHDVGGNPVATQPGDVVQVQSAGKTASVTIVPLTLKARTDAVSGRAQAGASIPIVTTHVGGNVSGGAVVTVGNSGGFRVLSHALYPTRTLPAGELAVSSITDAAGDQEAASACVPGIEVAVNSATVRGWTVGSAPRLVLIRHGHVLLTRRISPAPDGTFQLELQRHHRPLPVVPGDVLQIGSRQHHHNVAVPALGVSLRSGAQAAAIVAPRGMHATLSVLRSSGRSMSRPVTVPDSGRGSVTLPGGAVTLGDVATIRYVLPSGDAVIGTAEARGILVPEGSTAVSGIVHPGSVLSIHVLSPAGSRLGGAVVSADPATGHFSIHLRSGLGRSVTLEPRMQILIRDASGATVTTLPSLELTRHGKTVQARASITPHGEITWTGVDGSGTSRLRHLRANAAGKFAEAVTLTGGAAAVRRVAIETDVGGLTVERVLSLTPEHAAARSSRLKSSVSTCSKPATSHGKHSSARTGSCVPPVKGR